MLVTDGPFAEGKEHVGGFPIIKVADLDAALEWGRKLARARRRCPIEVRPFQDTSRPPGCRLLPDSGDRAFLPRGVRPRRGRPGPPLRRLRRRRGSGAGRVRRGGRALAVTGLPPSPAGWIITTARNRAIDRLRREALARRPARRRPRSCTRRGEPLERGCRARTIGCGSSSRAAIPRSRRRRRSR